MRIELNNKNQVLTKGGHLIETFEGFDTMFNPKLAQIFIEHNENQIVKGAAHLLAVFNGIEEVEFMLLMDISDFGETPYYYTYLVNRASCNTIEKRFFDDFQSAFESYSDDIDSLIKITLENTSYDFEAGRLKYNKLTLTTLSNLIDVHLIGNNLRFTVVDAENTTKECIVAVSDIFEPIPFLTLNMATYRIFITIRELHKLRTSLPFLKNYL